MALPMWLVDRWVRRIQEMFRDKIIELKSQDPGFEAKLREKAVLEAERVLGISGVKADIEGLEAEVSRLQAEIKEHKKQMIYIVTGEFPDSVSWYEEKKVKQALSETSDAEYQRLMREHPVGKEVQKLEREMARAADAVHLATSPRVLKDLLSKFTVSLGVELSDPEKIAMSVEDQED